METPTDGPEPLRVRLRDGTDAVIRPIRHTDEESLALGLQRLSSQSSHSRFFYTKTRYSEQDLHKLTTFDSETHMALVLGILDADGVEIDTVAVARCFVDRNDPRRGEVTVTVIDEWQNRGIASHLLRALARCCVNAGITTWQAVFLRDNTVMPYLLDQVGTRQAATEFGADATETFYALNAQT